MLAVKKTTASEGRNRSLVYWGLVVCIGIGAGVVFRGELSLRWLHFMHAAPTSQSSAFEPFSPGFELPGFEVDAYTIGYGAKQKRRVFLFFSSACPVCALELPAWKRLSGLVDRNETEIIALGLAEYDASREAEYLRNGGVNTTALLLVPASTRETYRLHQTPTTLLVDAGGRVELMVIGKLSATDIAALEARLDVHLRQTTDESLR